MQYLYNCIWNEYMLNINIVINQVYTCIIQHTYNVILLYYFLQALDPVIIVMGANSSRNN